GLQPPGRRCPADQNQAGGDEIEPNGFHLPNRGPSRLFSTTVIVAPFSMLLMVRRGFNVLWSRNVTEPLMPLPCNVLQASTQASPLTRGILFSRRFMARYSKAWPVRRCTISISPRLNAALTLSAVAFVSGVTDLSPKLPQVA